MDDANAREDLPAEIREDPPAETPSERADGVTEETEFLPFTPGDDLPDEVERVLEEAASGGTGRVAAHPEAAPHAGGVPASSEAGGGASESGTDELEELRAIFLGHAATGQLDIAQVAASLEDRLEGTRREIVSEMAAVERRLRNEIKGAAAELLSEVDDRALLHRDAAADSTGRADELLNLVSVTHESLRAELDKHHQETRHALDDVLSLVRELARTLVIMIAGNAEESPDQAREEADVLEGQSTAPGGSGDVDMPLLKELPVDRGESRAPGTPAGAAGGGSCGAGESAPIEASGAEPSRASRAAKFFF